MLPVVRSGLSAASQEIAVISNNIANASSLGFKRSNANFSDVYTEMSDVRNANRIGNGVRQESPRRNHSQGSLILTGNALDLGMNGQGMFILNTAEKLGELSYTRNGAMNVREDGKLVNSDGIAYLDINSQEINLPFQVKNFSAGDVNEGIGYSKGTGVEIQLEAQQGQSRMKLRSPSSGSALTPNNVGSVNNVTKAMRGAITYLTT